MNETPAMFGPGQSLMGILTQPATPDPQGVVVLMFNAGLISRIGPHRFNVKLARALAAAGHASFRFDLSGRGDSRGADSGDDFSQQSVRDIRSAMDHVAQACGARRFALVGICSGAVASLATALADNRVVGTLMFDGHTYPSRWTALARRWQRLQATPWPEVMSYFRRRVSGRSETQPAANPADGVPAGPEVDEDLSRADFVRQLGALVDRRVAVFLVYSGSWIDGYSYAGQFRDAFRGESFVDKVRCDFRPDIDHTMISLQAQRDVIELVLGWLPTVQLAAGVIA